LNASAQGHKKLGETMASEFEIWAATPTPFGSDGGLAVSVVAAQAKHLRTTGVHGAFVAGTTGEFPLMTVEERMALLAEWAAQKPDGLGLAVHVGHTDLRSAQELARHAEDRGVDMIAAVTPFYGQSNMAATVTWLADVAAAAPATPFCYYHIPAMTGSTHAPSELVRLAADGVPTLRAVKFTDSDLLEFARTRAVSPQVRVFWGRDELLPAALAFGADGVIGSLYNGLAPVAHAVVDATARGDLAEAYQLHRPFRDIGATADAHGGVGFVKELMNQLGPDAGQCRCPWGPVSASGRAEIVRLLPDVNAALAAVDAWR
jgi:N-acetylneuraminate lyase